MYWSYRYNLFPAREIFEELTTMSSRGREEDRRTRARSEDKARAPATHKVPSVVVSIPYAKTSWGTAGTKKEGRKAEKKKKKTPAATVTLADFQKHDPPALIIPQETGDLDGAVFDTAAFEREPVTPLHTTPLQVAMPASVPVLDQRVSYPVSAPAPPGDWRLEMRREMQDLMKESMREMMAAMPRVCNPVEDRCSLGTGQPDAQGPQSIRRAGNTVTPSGTGQLVQGPLAPAAMQQPCNSAYSVGTGLHGAQGPMATAYSQNTRNAVTSVGTGLQGV